MTNVSAVDPTPFDSLAFAVGVSGTVALAGAPWQDDNGTDSGAVYVFDLDGTSWVETQKLLASDGHSDDVFGRALAIDGPVAIIAALGHDAGAVNAGAVYYFRRMGATWREEQKLLAADPGQNPAFGTSVAVDDDVAVIGAMGGTGAAYVFRFDPQTDQWFQEQKLLPSDGANGDFFGISVAVDANVAVVGAEGQDFMCPGGFATQPGAAYVFRFHPESLLWVEEQKLTASDCAPIDNFGHAVAISAGRILVGAVRDDDNGLNSGSVYGFVYDPGLGQWTQQQKLVASDGVSGDVFGRSVAIDGGTSLIGAFLNDEVGADHGAAYVFRLEQGNWLEQQKLLPAPGPWTAFFGWSVDVSGDVAATGAYGENVQAGSAYLYAGLLGVDCNGNRNADSCDIIQGVSPDANGDGVPDECPLSCPWDLDGDGAVGIVDFLDLLMRWGSNPGGPPDFDGDGTVAITDFLELLGNWGPCV